MKRQRKSSRKTMLNRMRSRKTSPTYLASISADGQPVALPANRKAYKIELARLENANGMSERQHQKEVRKQRLTKARRKLRDTQVESRRANRD